MISIVVPVYNAEKYLQRCIESVTSQTVADLELILVNDGSRDSSLDICRRYAAADHRIKVIDKPNGGVSSARNVGIDHVKGEYVSFLDADDYFSPDFLEAFGTDHIQADFFSQGCISEYPDRPSRSDGHHYDGLLPLGEFMEAMLVDNMLNSPWAKLYSTRVLKENNIRFNERLSYAEDRLFNVHFLNHCKTFALSSGNGYFYTHDNPGALTRRPTPSELIMEYFYDFRPHLLKLTSQSDLSQKGKTIAGYSYNYHLIQAIIQVVGDKAKTTAEKVEFVKSIPSEHKKDASRQIGLPTLYKIIARLLRLPARIAVGIYIPLIKLKQNKI